ncbi:MAG: hypothetical protein JXR33_03595 [Coriobacteriia bacterium]|nr:hypothetical protein [Coriobacteriia bacterium]
MAFPGWYAVIVGALMLAQWGFSIAAGQVPELQSEPLRIAFHLVAEGTTAVLLLVAGVALLRERTWARDLALVAFGALIYTTIVSPGYFAQLGQWPFVAMFAALLALAVACIVILVRSPKGV